MAAIDKVKMSRLRPISQDTPLTWDLNDRLLSAIDQKTRLLTERGYAPLIGFELEFALKYQSFQNWEEFAQKKVDCRDQLLAKGNFTDSQKEQIQNFSMAELLVCEAHEKFRDILEFRFGTKDGGRGYYDSPGYLEIRTKPLPPSEAIRALHRLTDFLQEKARTYEKIYEFDHIHTNFSLNDPKQGNLMDMKRIDADSPEGEQRLQTLGGVIHGVLEVVSKISQAFLPEEHAAHFDAGPSRQNFLRLSNDHFELRWYKDSWHPAFDVLMLLAGIERGLSKDINLSDYCYPTAGYTRGYYSVASKKHIVEGIDLDVVRTILNGATNRDFGADKYIHPNMDEFSTFRNDAIAPKKASSSINDVILRDTLFGCGFLSKNKQGKWEATWKNNTKVGKVLTEHMRLDRIEPTIIHTGLPAIRQSKAENSQAVMQDEMLSELLGKNLLRDIVKRSTDARPSFIKKHYPEERPHSR